MEAQDSRLESRLWARVSQSCKALAHHIQRFLPTLTDRSPAEMSSSPSRPDLSNTSNCNWFRHPQLKPKQSRSDVK